MDSRNFAIGFLLLTAVLLIAGIWSSPATVTASEAIKDRDYQVVTARTQSGGDALYIANTRTGQMAVFAYDPAKRAVVARAVGTVSDLFNGNNR